MLAVGILLFPQVEKLDFVVLGRFFCFLYQNDSLILVDLTTKKWYIIVFKATKEECNLELISNNKWMTTILYIKDKIDANS